MGNTFISICSHETVSSQFNPFLNNVLILYLLKTPENQRYELQGVTKDITRNEITVTFAFLRIKNFNLTLCLWSPNSEVMI